jgi:Fe-S-cluster containining protein
MFWIDDQLNEIWPTSGGRCPFLRKARGKNIYSCRVHEAKPPVCEEFPGPYEDGTIHEWALKNCPGIKKERPRF